MSCLHFNKLKKPCKKTIKQISKLFIFLNKKIIKLKLFSLHFFLGKEHGERERERERVGKRNKTKIILYKFYALIECFFLKKNK